MNTGAGASAEAAAEANDLTRVCPIAHLSSWCSRLPSSQRSRPCNRARYGELWLALPARQSVSASRAILLSPPQPSTCVAETDALYGASLAVKLRAHALLWPLPHPSAAGWKAAGAG